MPRRKSAKDRQKPFRELNQQPPNVLQSNKRHNLVANASDAFAQPGIVNNIENVKPLLDDANSPRAGPSTSETINSSTAALHDALDSFRQRWRRELETKNSDHVEQPLSSHQANAGTKEESKENRPIKSQDTSLKDLFTSISNPPENPKEVYALAKRLFLIGVDLEQDDMHNESIRYYKQAMHLYPDIERQIFSEQCEASAKISVIDKTSEEKVQNEGESGGDEAKIPLLDRIKTIFYETPSDNRFVYCRPAHKSKLGTKHISDLPHDLLLQLFRYVIGSELDLASLESLGMVCRGFYILSQDPSLWRSICYNTWSKDMLSVASLAVDNKRKGTPLQTDWRQLYLDKPRLNYDGVYISRTKYIRQGDVGFQDITYRPFHVVRYFRYLRFFPDKRVLILTTNEEPDKIIPIFRHALHSKQFSSELAILEGVYEFVNIDEVTVTAEKDFTDEHNRIQQQTYNQRRQARFHWSRQTPLWQKFDLKFKLKTIDSRPFRNSTLKWLEYSILSKTETGQELTTFDISPDTFPNLAFSRVKRFNLRLSEPLPSH